MDVSLGKSLDAWIGRLIDFIGADPLRREVRLKLEAAPAPPRVEAPEKPAPKKKTAAPKKKTAAPKKKTAAPKKKAPRPRPALEEAVLRPETPPRRAGLEAADRQVLEALAAFAEGAGINELAAVTGQTAAALRRRLAKLAAAGQVERVAAGLRTRFRPIAD